MTNQEAIEILKIERDHMIPTLLTERIGAIDMAIYALQEQEEKNSKESSLTRKALDVPDINVGDMVSRQAVIEINQSYHGQMPNEVNYRIWKEINELPPAQPEKHTKERTETHACDCISRSAAIDAVNTALFPKINTAKDAEKALRNLPSAQPEIIRCKDCRWRKDQSGSTAWLPCRAIVTPSDFYCGHAERRTDDER